MKPCALKTCNSSKNQILNFGCLTLELIPLGMIRNSILERGGPNLSQFYDFHFDLLQVDQESTFLHTLNPSH